MRGDPRGSHPFCYMSYRRVKEKKSPRVQKRIHQLYFILETYPPPFLENLASCFPLIHTSVVIFPGGEIASANVFFSSLSFDHQTFTLSHPVKEMGQHEIESNATRTRKGVGWEKRFSLTSQETTQYRLAPSSIADWVVKAIQFLPVPRN